MDGSIYEKQENKTQAVANEVTQKKNREPILKIVDNRPEAIAQRKLQELANNSPQVKRVAQLQAMADNRVTQLAKGGKGSKHNRKNKRLAKQMGFHTSEFPEAVTAKELARSHQAKHEESPRYFYHGTKAKYLKGIQEKGLKAGEKPGLTARNIVARRPTAIDATHVFLYPNASSSSQDLANRIGDETVLLRVNINRLDSDLVNITKSELQFNGIIPPALIEVEKIDRSWKTLTRIKFLKKKIKGVPVPMFLAPKNIRKHQPDEESSDESDSDSDFDF